jgi:hypothetical protein
MTGQEFETLLSACAELAAAYPEGLIYIGGIAVYLHARNRPQAEALAEFTHDADFYISLADMGDLRDAETVVPNRRLSKHQLVKRGFEFDIYTERQSSLIVPYDAVAAHSVLVAGIRVACLEHLTALKLDAYRDRKASTKGEKDAKDVARMAAVAGRSAFRGALCAPYLTDEHLELLAHIERSPAIVALAHGNAVLAKKLRQDIAWMRKQILGASRDDAPAGKPRPR